MKAQVLYGINKLKYEKEYPLPKINDDTVLVKVKACGICGSDIDRVLKNGTYHFPTIIGHEFSGEVVDACSEEGKKWLKKRVTVFPLIPCKTCTSCLSGNYQLCEKYNYLGSRCDGAFAEFVAVPIWNLLEIPNDVSYEEAAMMEPLSVAMHTLRKVGNLLGKSVVITGSGAISSMLIQLAECAGAKKIVLLARNDEKLDYIKKISPNIDVFNILRKNPIEKVQDLMDGGAAVVIEGTGAQNMISYALQIVKRKGTIVLMGNPSDNVFLEKKNYWQILRKEIVLKGTWNSSYGILGKSDWEDVIELISNKRLNLMPLISHKITLDKLLDGILLMKNKTELSNKVMVVYEK